MAGVVIQISYFSVMTSGLGFGLSAYAPKMCFVLKGSDIGKHLKLYYDILSGKSKNIKFSVYDIDSRDIIHEVANSKKSTVGVSVDVNFLHNYEICWTNMDSDDKMINFSYKHAINHQLETKDVISHLGILEYFNDKSNQIRDLIFDERDQEIKFNTLMGIHEENINRLFMIKLMVLVMIVLLQVYLLSRLIDHNVTEMKTIVIGPH